MDTTSDDLTRPLGVTRSAPADGARGRALRRLLPVTGVLCLCLLAGAVLYSVFLGDPEGGIPRARVEIATRLPKAPEPLPADSQRGTGRRTGDEVESASGVSVARPAGTSVPGALVIRIPDDDTTIALKPAPDPRLVDRTRNGALPRIAPDGLRPLDAYARPATELPNGGRPAGRVALVVGGLGIGTAATRDAIARLPPPVTLAFAPYGSDLDGMAGRAREAGHEIMLQVPMEPFDYPDSDPGPHTLTTSAKPGENIEHLHWALGRFPGYVGVVNYMGGKLTADEKAIGPILREIGARGLGFIDDGSSSRSAVPGFKGETRIARAELVLDGAGRPDAIDKALERLEAAARSNGAVAIGTATALPLTVDRIERWAKGLEARGILLVPASAALRGPAREAIR